MTDPRQPLWKFDNDEFKHLLDGFSLKKGKVYRLARQMYVPLFSSLNKEGDKCKITKGSEFLVLENPRYYGSASIFQCIGSQTSFVGWVFFNEFLKQFEEVTEQ